MDYQDKYPWLDWLLSAYKDHDFENKVNQTALYTVSLADISDSDIVLDIGAGTGLLTFSALSKSPKQLFALDNSSECLNFLNREIYNRNLSNKISVINADMHDIPLENSSVNKIISRTSFMYAYNKQKVLSELFRVMKDNGKLSFFEILSYPRTFRIYDYLDKNTLNFELYKQIEDKVRTEDYDPLTDFVTPDFKRLLKKSGFELITVLTEKRNVSYPIDKEYVDAIFYDGLPFLFGLREKFMKYMSEEMFALYFKELQNQLHGKTVVYSSEYSFITAYKNPKYSLFKKLNNFLIKLNFNKLRKTLFT